MRLMHVLATPPYTNVEQPLPLKPCCTHVVLSLCWDFPVSYAQSFCNFSLKHFYDVCLNHRQRIPTSVSFWQCHSWLCFLIPVGVFLVLGVTSDSPIISWTFEVLCYRRWLLLELSILAALLWHSATWILWPRTGFHLIYSKCQVIQGLRGNTCCLSWAGIYWAPGTEVGTAGHERSTEEVSHLEKLTVQLRRPEDKQKQT